MLRKAGDRLLLLVGKTMLFGAMSFALTLGKVYDLRRKMREKAGTKR